MKFLVRVPAEVTASCTMSCSCGNFPDGPHDPKKCETYWTPYATLNSQRFDLYDKPRFYLTEREAIAAGKKELLRRNREWNSREGLK